MASTDSKLNKLNFLPGFHKESTQYAEEGKWFEGNRVRFREGKPENLRGYAKHNSSSFEECVVMAVNRGHDADTTGAVAGMIAGVYYGHDAIPNHFKDKLMWHDKLVEVAQDLHNMEKHN